MKSVVLGMALIYSLAGECGPRVHPQTTTAIIKVESGGHIYAIGDNKAKKAHAPKTKAEAVALAKRLVAAGHSIDMGLMQINSQHLRAGRVEIEDLFDACFNVRIGSAILAENFARFKARGQDDRTALLQALSAYNTGHPTRGAAYAQRVLRAAGNVPVVQDAPVALAASLASNSPLRD